MVGRRGWIGCFMCWVLGLGMWFECRKLGCVGIVLGGWVGVLGMELCL